MHRAIERAMMNGIRRRPADAPQARPADLADDAPQARTGDRPAAAGLPDAPTRPSGSRRAGD